jgi:hypothetical protein
MFILCRPFHKNGEWLDDESVKTAAGLPARAFTYVPEAAEADAMLLPFSVNDYVARGQLQHIEAANDECARHHIKAYAFVADDWGRAYPEFQHVTYFRMGGFRSQLSARNQGLPASLSDTYARIYGRHDVEVRTKQDKPVVGFCGHASLSKLKQSKELAKFMVENAKRGIENPRRKDWEPLFASAYQRALLLRVLESSGQVVTNVIARKQYRGGRSKEDLRRTTLEYYENLRTSDYVLCVRGGGNFSIRLYETLMVGRIPVFINTDCLLPQEDRIDWRKHVVWVEWADRQRIAQIIAEHHAQISETDFVEMQHANRKLWKSHLSVAGSLSYLAERHHSTAPL